MNSILATEPTAATEEKRPPLSPLETWADNPRMRHIPSVEWMLRKSEVDLRSRIRKLTAPFAGLPSADPHYDAIEKQLRAVGTAIDGLTTTVLGRRTTTNEPAALPERIEAALSHAASALRSLEPTPFGRRFPYNSFDRSRAEPVYGALVAVICHVDRLIPLIRAIDPDIDEKLLA